MTGKAMLGRSQELARIAAAYAGDADLVVVSGDAGMGKTRLVQEFLSDIPEERTVIVRCFQLAGEPVSFSALRQTMVELGASPSDQESGRTEQFSHWVSILDRRRAWTERAILVMEDLHWGDPSTFDFLTYLASGPERSKPFVIVTQRTDEPDTQTDLAGAWAELVRLPRTCHIDLQPLSADAAVTMVLELSDHAVSGDDALQMAGRSGGNPYLLGELVAAGGALPRHVRDVLLARARALSPEANHVLTVAAVAGPGISDEILCLAARLELREYYQAVDALVGVGLLLHGGGSYAFRHSLAREAVLQQALPSALTAAHFAVAMALEEIGPRTPVTAAAIALHWRASGHRDRAAPATWAAARMAAESFARVEAWQLYQWVMDLYGERVPIDALLEAAEAARWTGALQEASALLTRGLESVESVEQRVALLERLGRYLWEAGDGSASSAVLDQAAEILPPGHPSAIRASLAGAQARARLGIAQYELAEQFASESQRLAEELGDRAVKADALNTLGVAVAMQGRDEGLRYLQEALTLSLAIDSAEAICRAYTNLLFLHEVLGHPRETLGVVEEGLSALGKRGILLGRGASFANNAVAILLDRGRIEEASSLLDELTAQVQPQGRAQRLCILQADVALIRDDRSLARSKLDEARALQGVDEPWVISAYAVLEAELLLLEGHFDRAAVVVADALARISDSEPRAVAMLSRAALRISADQAHLRPGAAGLSDDEWCDDLLAHLPADEEAGPDASVPINCHVARLEAARRHRRDRPEDWRLAAQAWAEIERPRDMAYCRYREAVRLSEQRKLRDAGEAAGVARQAAEMIGDLPLLQRIDTLIRSAALVLPGADGAGNDSSVTPAARSGQLDFGLTAREREVLELIAEGATNRQISDRLFISERTAGVHVSAVLRKLGVANRVQAASLFHRHTG